MSLPAEMSMILCGIWVSSALRMAWASVRPVERKQKCPCLRYSLAGQACRDISIRLCHASCECSYCVWAQSVSLNLSLYQFLSQHGSWEDNTISLWSQWTLTASVQSTPHWHNEYNVFVTWPAILNHLEISSCFHKACYDTHGVLKKPVEQQCKLNTSREADLLLLVLVLLEGLLGAALERLSHQRLSCNLSSIESIHLFLQLTPFLLQIPLFILVHPLELLKPLMKLERMIMMRMMRRMMGQGTMWDKPVVVCFL